MQQAQQVPGSAASRRAGGRAGGGRGGCQTQKALLIFCGFAVKLCPHTPSTTEIQVARQLRRGRRQRCVMGHTDGLSSRLFCCSWFRRSPVTSAGQASGKAIRSRGRGATNLEVTWCYSRLLTCPSSCRPQSAKGLAKPKGARTSQTARITEIPHARPGGNLSGGTPLIWVVSPPLWT